MNFRTLLAVAALPLLGSAADLRFQVLRPDGSPAAGAKVHGALLSPGKSHDHWRLETDASGTFTVPTGQPSPSPHTPDGLFTVDVPGNAIAVVRYHATLSPPPPGATSRPIQLAPDRPIAGIVTAGSDPVPDARVLAYALAIRSYTTIPLGDPTAEAWPELGARADARGRFQLRTLEFPYDPLLRPHATGFIALGHHGKTPVCGLPLNSSIQSIKSIESIQPPDSIPSPTLLEIPTEPLLTLDAVLLDSSTGLPLAGVTSSGPRIGPLPVPAQTSDAQGRLRISGIPTFALAPGRFVFERENFGPVEAVWTPKDRKRLPGNMPVLSIGMGRPVRLTGRVVDAVTGGDPLVPIDISIHGPWKAPDGWTISRIATPGSDDASPGPNGSFDVRIPAGDLVVHAAAQIDKGAYRQAYDESIPLQLPPDGLSNVTLRVQRKPGVLVQLVSADPAQLQRWGYGGSLIIETRQGPEHGTSTADTSPTWFFPAAAWGDSVQIRMLRRRAPKADVVEDIELMPWTNLTANAKTWPIRLQVP